MHYLLSFRFVSKNAVLACGFMCLYLTACNQQTVTVNQIATQLRQRMLPDGGSASNPTSLSRNSSSQSTEWDIKCDLQWNELKKWLESRLAPDFKKIDESTGLVVFSRYDGHDSTGIEVRFNPPSQAHVRVTVSPG